MNIDKLPERWQKKLKEHLHSQGLERDELYCGDFEGDYKVEMEEDVICVD